MISSLASAPAYQTWLVRTVIAVQPIPGTWPTGKAVSVATVSLSTLLVPLVMGLPGSVRANLVLAVGLVGSAENCSGGIQRSNVMLVTVTLGESPVSSVIVPLDSVRV